VNDVPDLTLHVLPPSHPRMAVEAALHRKGLPYEKVALIPGERVTRRWFPDYPGDVPAGAFPAGWAPPALALS